MCGRATFAIDVSSTSMKAAIATVAAMIHGLNFGFHCCAVGTVAIPSSEFGSGAVESCPQLRITVASLPLDPLERLTPDQPSPMNRAHIVRKARVAATVVHSQRQGFPQCRFPVKRPCFCRRKGYTHLAGRFSQ